MQRPSPASHATSEVPDLIRPRTNKMTQLSRQVRQVLPPSHGHPRTPLLFAKGPGAQSRPLLSNLDKTSTARRHVSQGRCLIRCFPDTVLAACRSSSTGVSFNRPLAWDARIHPTSCRPHSQCTRICHQSFISRKAVTQSQARHLSILEAFPADHGPALTPTAISIQ